MANAARITVGITAVAVAGKNSVLLTHGQYALFNRGTTSIDLGDSGVASGTGFEIPAGEGASFDLAPGDTLYAIGDSGGGRLDALRLERSV